MRPSPTGFARPHRGTPWRLKNSYRSFSKATQPHLPNTCAIVLESAAFPYSGSRHGRVITLRPVAGSFPKHTETREKFLPGFSGKKNFLLRNHHEDLCGQAA